MTFEIFFVCQAEEAMAGVAAMNMSMSNMSTAAEVTGKKKSHLSVPWYICYVKPLWSCLLTIGLTGCELGEDLRGRGFELL